MQREIDLDGGEITVLKALGSAPMAGKLLVQQVGDVGENELVDTIVGLIDRGFVLSSKVNVLKIDDVLHSFFRVNPSYARDLRGAMRPGSRRDEDRSRRRRRG